jgi:predicted RNase H-like nuclease (RuvC/YqgF family)
VPQPPQPPHRRVTDRERRRWPDSALDQLDERIDEHDTTFEDVRRRLSELRRDLTEMRSEMREEARINAEFRREIRGNFARNFREHGEVKKTAEEIAQTVKPTRLDAAVKYATIISFLLVPILAAWVASGQ